MPAIGLGTWELRPDDVAQRLVAEALRLGYRLIDTATLYDNERGVGAAVAVSGLPRKDIFVTTKLWNDDQGYEPAKAALSASLQRLELDYVDLYLIHWPVADKQLRRDSWRALCELQQAGQARDIGVSNYPIALLSELLGQGGEPAVNQIEFHPLVYRRQKETLEFCAAHGIAVQAYSPLSKLDAPARQVIAGLADRLGQTPQQIVLRWCIQHGTVPLPRSRNPEHLASNLAVFDFELSAEEMRTLDAIGG